MKLFLVLISFALLTGCQLTQSGDATPVPTDAESATAEATEAATPDFQPEVVTEEPDPFATPTDAPRVTLAPSDVLLGGVLAWIGGDGVINLSGRTAQIALIGTDGAISTLLEFPDTGRPAAACGERATSPDGQLFAFYVGDDRGALYMMRGAQPPVALGEIEYLACLGMGTFRYSPAGGRFAYLDYVFGAALNDFADGVLRIYDSTSLAQVASFEDVVAYDLGDNDAAFLRFYASAEGIADEAAVIFWDGANERELATLLPTEEGCRFTSGQIVRVGGDPLLVMGHRCTRGDTTTHWQLYSVSVEEGSVTLIDSDSQPGSFVTFARTNVMFSSPDGETVYFTVPDGVTAYTVAVAAIQLSQLAEPASLSIVVPVARQAVFPNYSGTTNAAPRFAPDGRWLAAVVTSPDGDNQLVLMELDAPEDAPLTVGAGARGDLIPAFAFSALSERLYYVAGGDDNALYALDLASGAERRITRGQFVDALVVQGDRAAVLERRLEEQPPAEFVDLVLVNLGDGSRRIVFRSEPVAGGGSTIAVPLTWR
ncbi:MAG: hypothetical protein L6Q98_02770 [Anaerolineae bacterium]|nr:hypothetical protein [Anaerolineae bacterium]NUQ03001.1 hypothetical protein [Anaerolineae bacterium]